MGQQVNIRCEICNEYETKNSSEYVKAKSEIKYQRKDKCPR